MDIRQINPNNELSNNSLGKTNKSSKPDRTSSTGKSEAKKSNPAKGDTVNLSGLKHASEIDFARTSLDKLNAEKHNSLKKIKQKINQGAYVNNKDVQSQVGSGVETDLKSLASLLDERSAGSSSHSISAEQKDFLLNNDKVIDKITGKLIDDLNKI